jgi:hypothetical protein
MKLTWFGGTTIRIHLGGSILVLDPAGAPDGIDAAELVSGADQVIEGFGAQLPSVDAGWAPRKPVRLLDEGDDLPSVEAWTPGSGAVLLDAVGEAPLLLLAGDVPDLGRWVERAVVVLFGEGLLERGEAVLGGRVPRLIVLAAGEPVIDSAIPVLQGQLDGSGLVALEAGLALEV